MYGKIQPPYWNDRPVAVMGGGPSLIGFDFEQVRGAHVLAVQATIFDIPWADAGFGLGTSRFNEWRAKLANVRARVYWAVPENQIEGTGPALSRNITFLRRLDGQDLSDNPGEIHSGGTSGFGALQVCIHKRAREIILFGFDYDGIYNGGFSDKRRAQNAEHWSELAEHFSIFVPYLNANDIHVINACPASAIRCFQKMSLRDGAAIARRTIATEGAHSCRKDR